MASKGCKTTALALGIPVWRRAPLTSSEIEKKEDSEYRVGDFATQSYVYGYNAEYVELFAGFKEVYGVRYVDLPVMDTRKDFKLSKCFAAYCKETYIRYIRVGNMILKQRMCYLFF